MEQDIERIKSIIDEQSQRYHRKGGSLSFAGIEGSTIRIAPAGYCWR